MNITLDAAANLNVAETAALLGCSVMVVRAMIKRGDIKAHRYTQGGHFYIPLPEIERILNEQNR